MAGIVVGDEEVFRCEYCGQFECVCEVEEPDSETVSYQEYPTDYAVSPYYYSQNF